MAGRTAVSTQVFWVVNNCRHLNCTNESLSRQFQTGIMSIFQNQKHTTDMNLHKSYSRISLGGRCG